jgi:CheY-like chemotaxis protein
MVAPRRVLVIEDDAVLRDVLCEALDGAGYRALPSDHAISPLDVQQLRPALVVLDLVLDGEPEGYGWLEKIRAWHWTKQLPVVVCSGYLAPESPAAQWVQAMAAATVSKPFTIEDFLTTVAGCLEPPSAPPPSRTA